MGHACWAYVTARLVSRPLGVRPNIYLLLILGILPDIDLIFGSLGVQHRTLTHSIVFWSILFVPFFVKHRATSIPYFVALIQHILIGDLIVGKTSILWPIADLKIGLGLTILSPVNLVLEGAGLAVFAALIFGKDRLFLFGPRKPGVLAVLVIVPLAGFVVFVSGGGQLGAILLEHSDAKYLERSIPSLLSSGYLQAAIAMHLGLLSILILPFLQHSRWISRSTPASKRSGYQGMV
ncbi:MAG: metal-dependent hydrolase [Nitrososphaera sp.]